ncbi:hydroxyproline dehydrogenase isoform X2 [Taeniopygia guttata]|uniref:hydroxyproline dehydrogenase isoform X2 n=1 Tax=Taeniopygia guttata TaxID=59729 RepID=UPI003BB888DB
MPGSMGQEGSVGQEGSMGRRVGQEGSMGQSVGQEGSMGESVGQEGSMGRRVGQVQAQLGQGRALAVLTWGELLRALLVLGLCAHPRLQRDPQAFLLLSRRALGRRLWRLLLSVSLWGHFAVGLSPTAVAVLGRRLRARGLRPLLALPLEGDAPHGQGEARLQQNCGAALRCVGLAAAAGPEPAMQLKLTALLDPRLCEKIALRLAEPEGAGLSPEEVAAMLDGQAPALDWLSPDENEALGRGLGRLQRVVQAAVAGGVQVLVDAELSHLNPALTCLTCGLIWRHNRAGPRPWVWYTWQAYLRLRALPGAGFGRSGPARPGSGADGGDAQRGVGHGRAPRDVAGPARLRLLRATAGDGRQPEPGAGLWGVPGVQVGAGGTPRSDRPVPGAASGRKPRGPGRGPARAGAAVGGAPPQAPPLGVNPKISQNFPKISIKIPRFVREK